MNHSALPENSLSHLIRQWEADDRESLDTFGQHLMGGAVLSCAEQLRAAIAAAGSTGGDA